MNGRAKSGGGLIGRKTMGAPSMARLERRVSRILPRNARRSVFKLSRHPRLSVLDVLPKPDKD